MPIFPEGLETFRAHFISRAEVGSVDEDHNNAEADFWFLVGQTLLTTVYGGGTPLYNRDFLERLSDARDQVDETNKHLAPKKRISHRFGY